MLGLPSTTEFNKRIPKQKFYENLNVSLEIKKLFVEQIKTVWWANKIAPETINIAAGQDVSEIEVFHIKLAGNDLDSRVLRLMDKQIPYHILFCLERPDGCQQLVIGYKEAAQAGANAFLVRQMYSTAWLAPELHGLELTTLNMDLLYESIVRQIAGDALQAPESDSLKEAVEYSQQQEKLKKEIARLEAQAIKEKQPKRKFELHQQILQLKDTLEKKEIV